MAEVEATQNPTEVALSPEKVAPTLLGGDATKVETTQQQTEETQTVTPKVEEKPADAAKVKVDGAPEKYEFKAPEGTEYDSNIIDAFAAGAKEANLTQDAAQKLLETMSPKIAERQLEQVVAIRKEWFEQSKADKEFGGDKLEANLGTAKKALDSFGSPELNALLVSTGLGNHPEVIRLMVKVGKALSEDSIVTGATSATSDDPAKTMFPSMK